ncbi:MAG: hypothetical protein MUF51_09345 [Vicinamibacteria bacterium]|jgi:hypothetical protein|nr:hypothetical protein [Vicinamibacteria bacterium]
MIFRHPSEDQLLDVAVGGGAAAQVTEHLKRCERCRLMVQEAQAGFQLCAAETEVPEPHPAFWHAMRQRVQSRIDEQPRGLAIMRRLVPLVAAASALLIVATWHFRHPLAPQATGVPVVEQTIGAWTLPAGDDDPNWSLVETAYSPSSDEGEAPCVTRSCYGEWTEEEGRQVAAGLASAMGGKL